MVFFWTYKRYKYAWINTHFNWSLFGCIHCTLYIIFCTGAQYPSKKTLTIFSDWSLKPGSTIKKLWQYLKILECYDITEGNMEKFIGETKDKF